MHWIETYPHKVYASVLLYEGKIYNYKIGENYWISPLQVTFKWQQIPENYNELKVEHTYFTVNNSEEHHKAFTEWSKEWYKQWEIHPTYNGTNPY